MSNILIIEDNQVVIKTIAIILSRQNYSITTATNGKQAWELLNRFHYDLIISDLMLPYASGIELITRIRGDVMHKAYQTPVLILSSLQTEESVIDGFDAGASDYLKKPFTPGELLSRVKRLLHVKV